MALLHARTHAHNTACTHACLTTADHHLPYICKSPLQVVDHYENPRNIGALNKQDKDVGTGLVGAPACGDVMKLQVKVCVCWCVCCLHR